LILGLPHGASDLTPPRRAAVSSEETNPRADFEIRSSPEGTMTSKNAYRENQTSTPWGARQELGARSEILFAKKILFAAPKAWIFS
jgi:hypothetical protein